MVWLMSAGVWLGFCLESTQRKNWITGGRKAFGARLVDVDGVEIFEITIKLSFNIIFKHLAFYL